MGMPAASAASSGGAPAAKRVKTEPATIAAGAAMAAARPVGMPTSAALPNAALLQQQQQAMAMAMAAGMARPPLPPGSMPGAQGMAHISAAQQAVFAQQRLQQALLHRPKFAPIVRPASEDERQFVPRQRLQVGGWKSLRTGNSSAELPRLLLPRVPTSLLPAFFLSDEPPVQSPHSPYPLSHICMIVSRPTLAVCLTHAQSGPALQALVRQVGLGMSIMNAKATEEAEEALRAVAEDFISSAGRLLPSKPKPHLCCTCWLTHAALLLLSGQRP